MRARSCSPSLILYPFPSLLRSFSVVCTVLVLLAAARWRALLLFFPPIYLPKIFYLYIVACLRVCVCVGESLSVCVSVLLCVLAFTARTHSLFFHSAAAQTGVCFGSPCGLLVRELFVELCRVSLPLSSLPCTRCVFPCFPFHFLPACRLLLFWRIKLPVSHTPRALNVARIVPAWCGCRIYQTSSLSLCHSSFLSAPAPAQRALVLARTFVAFVCFGIYSCHIHCQPGSLPLPHSFFLPPCEIFL